MRSAAAGLLNVAEIAAAPRVVMMGADAPARFADLATECRAVRQQAGVFDAGFRAWWRLRGEDRVSFLQGMVSNDVKVLAAGQGCPALLLTQQGKVVSDLRVYARADHFLLDFPANGAAPARAALEKLIVADDVEIEPLDLVLIGVEGRRAADVLARLGIAVEAGGLAVMDAVVAGRAVLAATASHAGEAGMIIGCAAAGAPAVWRAVRAAGAVPVGMEAINVLRLEAGIPWLGTDMDEETLAMEAGLEAAISFKKGCYLGQEVVERIAARGHINRLRVGLRLEGGPVAAGTPLAAGGNEVGWITSAAVSPLLGAVIAMAYVRREHAAPGTALVAGAGAAAVRAEVAELPFCTGTA